VKSTVAFALVALLAACAQLPSLSVTRQQDLAALPQPEHFRLDGRLSVRAEARAFSGGLNWLRAVGDERIVLSTPLGQAVAEIRRESEGLRLTDAEGHSQLAQSGEALLERALGIGLPADSLRHWAVARPHPASPFSAELDTSGRVMRLSQDGWRIEYGRYRQAGTIWLPGRLFARQGEAVELRLVVDAWVLP
jgi:outer membrane lipoprotein LolB